MSYQPIENYGVIGDLHTVALVGMNGSIDFMCYPRFDSPSIFARLLDDQGGGFFSLEPLLEGGKQKQLYLPGTNVLLSRFLSHSAVAEISDFMPAGESASEHTLIRRAKTVRGEAVYRMICSPAFDYARYGHRIEERDGEILFVSDGPDQTVLRLHSQIPMRVENGAAVAEFTLRTGQSAAFVLEDGATIQSQTRHPAFVPEAFKQTVNYWRGWLRQSTYQGRWREMVHRSALTLKLLTSEDHGSIVAAPTFGLPELIGGERNWDYRYTWIRDASFTLYALIRLGFTQETAAFMHWIEARIAELGAEDSLEIMYQLDGGRSLKEEILPHMQGYKGSSPVRIGNGASDQLQLDIFGELMDSVYLYDKHGEPLSYEMWKGLTRLLDWVGENWEQPDEGIWEVRGGRQHFLYSRLMTWVALDRGIRLAAKRSFPAPLDRWRRERDRIYHDIHENFWIAERKAFGQFKGSTAVDAASLLMPLVRFISPTDPRWLSHLAAIEEELVVDAMVYRYKVGTAAEDGLEGEEGTFSMCSFWYVECLSRAGELQKARLYFEKMLGYANHLGLYAEELGPEAGHLGNFPQAFTHKALISAAYDIDRRLSASRND
jgi:GH15 family glucan-1,4-alpha-glucosidase